MRPIIIIDRTHRQRDCGWRWWISLALCVVGICGLLWLTFCYSWAAVRP